MRRRSGWPEPLRRPPKSSPNNSSDLLELRERIDVLEDRTAEALALHTGPHIFRSLPRAGTVRAALLLAELGDCHVRSRPRKPWPLQPRRLTLDPDQPRSHIVVFRHACDKGLRAALIDFAADSRQASPWAKDIYDGARAWVRVLWRCWTDQTTYDPTRHGGLQEVLESAAA